MNKIRRHLDIYGRVQGVAYRYSMCQEATHLDLTGWVRNLPDGRVEAMIEGEEDKVEELIQWCYKGPPGAKVLRVNVSTRIHQGEFVWFGISY